MTERRYSVAEIDRMRAALCKHLAPRSYMTKMDGTEMQQYEAQMAPSRRDAEDQLRTYMLAGVGPEELETHLASMPRNAGSPITIASAGFQHAKMKAAGQ